MLEGIEELPEEEATATDSFSDGEKNIMGSEDVGTSAVVSVKIAMHKGVVLPPRLLVHEVCAS